MKRLGELLVADEVLQVQNSLEVELSDIFYDTRRAQPQGCYVAIKGFKRDGIEFLPQAVAAGANSVVTSHPPDPHYPHLTWVQVKNDRRVLSSLSARFFDNPSRRLKVIGITGTNGKTTTALLTDAVYNRQSSSAWIGTLGMEFRGERRQVNLTTPEAPDLFRFMSEVELAGCRYLVMEASSASLALFRVEDVLFSQAIFTSFSGEHLDFHGTMENYFAAKLSLFRRLQPEAWAIVNADDPMAPKILHELICKYVTFGFNPSADIRPLKNHFSIGGISALLATPRGQMEIQSPLIGKFNLYNIMAAVASAQAEGLENNAIAQGIASCRQVQGRAELIHRGDFSVVLDFAHTDDALRHLLLGLRDVAGRGRIIIVFGAGGDKDKTKRPRMGKVSATLADEVVVTSDNPRSEDPQTIMDEIIAGIPAGQKNWRCEADREKAIAIALRLAKKGDIVAIAGKGHEQEQIVGNRRIPFRDDEVVLRLLEARNA